MTTTVTRLDPLTQLHELVTDLTTRRPGEDENDPGTATAIRTNRVRTTECLNAANRLYSVNMKAGVSTRTLAENKLATDAAEDTLDLAQMTADLAEISTLRASLILGSFRDYNVSTDEYDKIAPVARSVADRTRRLLTHLTQTVHRELETGEEIAPPVARTARLVLDELLDRAAAVKINMVMGPLNTWSKELETACRALGVPARGYNPDRAKAETVLNILRTRASESDLAAVATRAAVAVCLAAPLPVAEVGEIIERLATERRIVYTRAAGWSNPER